jgi:hypothetical protein
MSYRHEKQTPGMFVVEATAGGSRDATYLEPPGTYVCMYVFFFLFFQFALLMINYRITQYTYSTITRDTARKSRMTRQLDNELQG